MKHTIGDVEYQIRLKMLDTNEEAFKYTPTEVFLAVKNALETIRRTRPESRYVGFVLTDEMILTNSNPPVGIDFVVPESFPVKIGNLTYSLSDYRKLIVNLDERWIDSIVFNAVHHLYLKDDSDTANVNLSNAYFNKYMESIKS